ncbi:PRL-1 phosphatase-like [Anabrus simplex]|uniref:PRL-1 phosphatase-like n=1 Tax=Anabrus simplex TaxID=316456 RepID=UPI0035A2E0AF
MSMTPSNMQLKDIRPAPCEIEYKNMKFLITDRPTEQTIHNYIQELKKHRVRDAVRVCEPTYQTEELQNEGINVFDLEFDDGTPPPSLIVEEWFELLKKRFRESPDSCVAVHCVAGLVRVPVMVALALMELGMKYEDAVDFIKRKQRGAINSKQLAYLEKYRPKSRLKLKNGHKNACCLQ